MILKGRATARGEKREINKKADHKEMLEFICFKDIRKSLSRFV